MIKALKYFYIDNQNFTFLIFESLSIPKKQLVDNQMRLFFNAFSLS